MTSSSFQIPNHDSHWSIHAPLINWLIDWWLMNGGCGEMGVCCWYWWGMNALTLAESWCLVCGVTCILKESSKLAGWQAWLAGRLLRSAVVFAPMKQYGHVPSIVVWLTHGQWSYVPNKWLPGHGTPLTTPDPSSWPQHTLVAILPSTVSYSISPAMMVAAGDSNAPPPDYESGVLPIHYTSGTAHERIRLRRARRTRADAATRARATDLDHQDSRIYNDMRRIRTEALLSYVKKWNGTCVGLTAWLSR